MTRTRQPVSCSFCGKGQREVRHLIAGPNVFICDECGDRCADVLADERAGESQVKPLPLPGDNRALEARAHALLLAARRLADASEKAMTLPRPVAERARALAEEVEVFLAADPVTRAVLAEYARSVAVNVRHFARVCDAAELSGGISERARALVGEIEELLRPP
jgi:hypothetical protein